MQIRLFIISLLVLCAFSGCGKDKRPADMPALYPCEITITQGGQSLAGALVTLKPTGKWIMDGKTASNGTANIRTHGKFAGVPAGTYTVCVSKIEISPSSLVEPSKDASYEEWQDYHAKANAEKRPKYQLVNPEYGTDTSTLSITVSKGKTRQTFDVGDAVKIEEK